MAASNYIPSRDPVVDHEKRHLRYARQRLQFHNDHYRLSPLELLVAMTVESGGGFYAGLQPAIVKGQHSLVIFQTSFGASLALTLDELSTQAVRNKLQLAHQEFGVEWED